MQTATAASQSSPNSQASADADAGDAAPLNSREIANIRKRLRRWEFDHLRAHCAELADRLEIAQQRIDVLENEVRDAWRWGEHWRDQTQYLADELHEAGKAIGLTPDGELVAVEAPAQGGAA